MNCRLAKAKISEYLDSELSGHDMMAVRYHLSQCSACEQEFEVASNLKQRIGQLKCAEPAPEFESRLFEAVLNSVPVPARRPISIWRYAAVTAMASALVVLGVLQFLDQPHSAPIAQDPRSMDVATDQALQGSLDPFGSAPVITVSNAGR